MVGWHHQLNGHEFEQTPGDGEEQGSLEHCSPWGQRESDTAYRLNNKNNGLLENSIRQGHQQMSKKAPAPEGRKRLNGKSCQPTKPVMEKSEKRLVRCSPIQK